MADASNEGDLASVREDLVGVRADLRRLRGDSDAERERIRRATQTAERAKEEADQEALARMQQNLESMQQHLDKIEADIKWKEELLIVFLNEKQRIEEKQRIDGAAAGGAPAAGGASGAQLSATAPTFDEILSILRDAAESGDKKAVESLQQRLMSFLKTRPSTPAAFKLMEEMTVLPAAFLDAVDGSENSIFSDDSDLKDQDETDSPLLANLKPRRSERLADIRDTIIKRTRINPTTGIKHPPTADEGQEARAGADKAPTKLLHGVKTDSATPRKAAAKMVGTPSEKMESVSLADIGWQCAMPVDVKYEIDGADAKCKKAMRTHKFGKNETCVPSDGSHRCASLRTSKEFSIEIEVDNMCKLLDSVTVLALMTVREMAQSFYEDHVQQLIECCLSVLCKWIRADEAIEVIDIRHRPQIYLLEKGIYFKGYGDLLVLVKYPNGAVTLDVAAFVIEVKKDALDNKGLGQLSGQILHFCGRQVESRVCDIDDIRQLNVAFCSGILMNACASAILTYAPTDDSHCFIVEKDIDSPFTALYTLIQRSLELRTFFCQE
eukprot:m.149233 g.149233  ORF g.149233 m.149233 type:complete len:553 (+) comp11669_c0_seq29:70-1728(+)